MSSVEVGLASSGVVNHRSSFPFVDVRVHLDLTNSATWSVASIASGVSVDVVGSERLKGGS